MESWPDSTQDRWLEWWVAGQLVDSGLSQGAIAGLTEHPRNAHEAVQQPDAADGAGLRQKLLRQGRPNSRNAPPLIWGVLRTVRGRRETERVRGVRVGEVGRR